MWDIYEKPFVETKRNQCWRYRRKGDQVFSQMWILFSKDAVSFEWSVSKLSQWSTDILVQSFQFNNMTFLAMVNNIIMNDARYLEVCNEEMSPSSAIMGDEGMLKLRISACSQPLTRSFGCVGGASVHGSDHQLWWDNVNMCYFGWSPYGRVCEWWCGFCERLCTMLVGFLSCRT